MARLTAMTAKKHGVLLIITLSLAHLGKKVHGFVVSPAQTRVNPDKCGDWTLRSRLSGNDTDGDEFPVIPLTSRSNRRDLFWLAGNSMAAISSLSVVSPANAAPPMSAGEADNVGARADRALRPKPPKVLRQRLQQDFAVLLMRSSYNALDELNCVAMDQFQRDFFFIRQAEYQPYVNMLGPGSVKQGELVDPNYFDFISFAQHATIARDMRDPPGVFEEMQPVEVGEDEPQMFAPVVVRRDTDIRIADLPAEHGRMVGRAILSRLNETFGDTTSAIPSIPKGNVLLTSLEQMMRLFLVNGFAWDGTASMKPSSNNGAGATFSLTFTSPATLWSGQALLARKASPLNNFALKVALVMAQDAGYKIQTSSTHYSGNKEISEFTVA
eukprot:scaffold272907_cov60-Attheya_sp.AAC.4